MEISIEGIVSTESDDWISDYLKWLESRGESFGGGIKEYIDED